MKVLIIFICISFLVCCSEDGPFAPGAGAINIYEGNPGREVLISPDDDPYILKETLSLVNGVNYLVDTINGMRIDVFAEKFSGEAVYPLELVFKSYDIDSEGHYNFTGDVTLTNLGQRSIKVSAVDNGERDTFIVDTDGELGPVTFIYFFNLKAERSSISGYFGLGGPTIDVGYYSFTAKAE